MNFGARYVDPLLSNELEDFNDLYDLITTARFHIRSAAQKREAGDMMQYSSHLHRLGNSLDIIMSDFGSKGMTCFYEYKSDRKLFKMARRLYRKNGGHFKLADIDLLKNFHDDDLFYRLPFVDHEIRLNTVSSGVAVDMAYSLFGFNPREDIPERRPDSSEEERAAIVHHFSQISIDEHEESEFSSESARPSRCRQK